MTATQTVDPKTAAPPATGSTKLTEGAAASAKDNTLETLLAEFEPKPAATETAKPAATETAPPAPSTTTTAAPISKADADAVKALLANEQKKRVDADVQSAVSTIKNGSEVLGTIPERLVEAELYRRAATDQRFMEAFMMRSQQPERWNAIVKAVGSEMEAEVAKAQTSKMGSDRLRVQASVRGIASRPVSQEDVSNAELSRLNPRQFNAYKRNLAAGKDPREALKAVLPQRN